MTVVRLIMSGAMVGQELAAEFGPLPPSFLPVGSQRLYQLQVASLAGAEGLHMVLPEGFNLSAYDAAELDGLGVEIIRIPEGLSLGEAVVYALNSIGSGDGPAHILHGDTLIAGAPLGEQDRIVGAGRTSEYAWAEMELDPQGRVLGLHDVMAGADGHEGWPVASGYFAFSSSLDLVRSLTRMRGNFIAGVNHYLSEHEVRLAAADSWLDFGHLQTFFRSKLSVTTARAFNTIRFDGLTARKASHDQAKIWGEAHWLQEAPPAVQVHCARLLAFGGEGEAVFYETEYEYLPVLSELFVHGAIGRQPWLRILGSCEDFLKACAAHSTGASADKALEVLTVDKTLKRLEAFGRATGFPIETPLRLEGVPMPSLIAMAERLAVGYDLASGRTDSVMHGDLCFSNILYDSRVQRIKAIDPRGLVGEQPTIYGDLRYDLAKLAHSVVGRYDQIISGRYGLRRNDLDYAISFEDIPAQPWLERALGDLDIQGVRGLASSVRAVMTGLFLAMLPLHADRPDRQHAFIANALRLFRSLDR